MRHLRFRALAVALALSASPAVAADTPRDTRFTVVRDGEPVGTHMLRFSPAPEGLKVAVDTKVVVRLAMIPVYRFEHHGQELWRDDRLAALSSTTNDDGTRHVLNVAAGASGLQVDSDGKSSRMPAGTLPASLWNAATTSAGILMNTLDGSALAVRVTDRGEETLKIAGRPATARHYSLAGDLSRDVWYDSQGNLVQVRFKAKDDSLIEYLRN